jgi:hypothetical protein
VLGSPKRAILSLVCAIHGDEEVSRLVLVYLACWSMGYFVPRGELESVQCAKSFLVVNTCVHLWQSKH